MSSSNSAFNIQGALLPQTGGNTTPATQGVTPFSNALNGAKFGTNGYQAPAIPAPSTPVKKITTPDGTSTEFHVPVSGVLSSASGSGDSSGNSGNTKTSGTTSIAPDDPSNKYNTQTGQLNPNYPGYVAPTTGPTNSSSSSLSTTPPPSTNSAVSGAASGLLQIGTQGSTAYDQAVQNYQNLQNELAQKGVDISAEGIPLQYKVGQQAALQNQYNTELNTAQNAINQQQTQQSTQAGALSTLGNLGTATAQQGQYNYVQGGPIGETNGGTSGTTLTYNPTTDASNFAKSVISGSTPYSDAVSAMGYASNGTALLQSAIQAAGGNLSQIEAKTPAQQAGVAANTSDLQSIAGAQQNIDSLTQLINNSNLNSKGINIQNATIQALQNNLSNSDYATLTNALNSIDAALSSVTGAPVNIAQLSTSQGTSLITTINNQVALAKGIAQGKLAGGSTVPSSGTTGSFTTGQTAGGGSIVWNGTQWVVNQ